jgi:hypothetical protein
MLHFLWNGHDLSVHVTNPPRGSNQGVANGAGVPRHHSAETPVHPQLKSCKIRALRSLGQIKCPPKKARDGIGNPAAKPRGLLLIYRKSASAPRPKHEDLKIEKVYPT